MQWRYHSFALSHWYGHTQWFRFRYILMAKCKTAITPMLMYWSYCSLALSHQFIHGKYHLAHEVSCIPEVSADICVGLPEAAEWGSSAGDPDGGGGEVPRGGDSGGTASRLTVWGRGSAGIGRESLEEEKWWNWEILTVYLGHQLRGVK